MGEKRTHVFLDVASGTELVMPTYAQVGYTWRHGMGMETVALSELGDVAVPTVRTLCAEPLKVLLPANEYPFNVPGADLDPWTYIEALERRCDARSVQRYIITGTPVNAAVYIKEIAYTEEDGTGDLTVTIHLQEAKTPKAIPAASTLGLTLELNGREETGNDIMGSTYVVVQGDTMCAIARRFYGDGSLAWRLAAYNDIPNANFIRPGQVLRIPAKDQLPAAASVTRPASVRAVEEALTDEAPPTSGPTPVTPGTSGVTPSQINRIDAALTSGRSGLTPSQINRLDAALTSKNSGLTPSQINRLDAALTAGSSTGAKLVWLQSTWQ